MKYFYIQRWLASKVKLEGKTVRESPSEHTWELVFDNKELDWYRLSGNFRKDSVFGNKIEADKKAARELFDKLEVNRTISIKPGEPFNDTKNTLVFMRLAEKGRCTAREEGSSKVFSLRDKELVFEPRKGREGQFRISMPGGLGDETIETFAMKEPKLQILEDKNNQDVVTLRNVPIAKAGVWNGIEISKKILDGLKARFEKLKEKLFVPLKLEHSGIKESEEQTPQGPALGWLTKIFLFGDSLYGDFVKVPKSVARLIKNGQYIGVSPEIARNFEGTPDVLVGVALLGAALPAMTSLPKLLTIYAEKEGVETYHPPIPFSAFGGEMENELKENPQETEVKEAPETPKVETGVEWLAKLVFQRKSGPDDMSDVVGALQLKRYPKALSDEMVELLPDATVEKVDVIPEYDVEMLGQRLDVLSDRAKQPEKCEKVIEEVEEALDIFKDELAEEDNKAVKAKAEEVLAEAKENKGTTELEEAIESEAPVEVELPVEESYPKIPDNVQIDLQKLEEELKRRALGLVKATVEKFQSAGWDAIQCQRLEQVLVQLDTALTPTPDSSKVRTLVFQMLESAPRKIETFSQVTTPHEAGPDLVETLLGSTKRARAKR